MWRQSARTSLIGLLLLLAACSGKGPEQGDVGFVDGFFGGLIADEPRAALVGREVLSAGGTAADAAVAAYFTMAVTMPGAASLGGGGVCLVHDAVEVETKVLSFLPKATVAGDQFPMPGNIRGMFLLHARYGDLNWSSLLQPAERYARDGHTLSRAFVRDFYASQAVMSVNQEAVEIFGNGKVVEGKLVRQVELGAIISNLRTRGPGDFYDGSIGRLFVESVSSVGGKITIADLREYRPVLQEPLKHKVGNNFLVFPRTDGGVIASRIWEAAKAGDRFEDADATERHHLVLEAAGRAYQATAQRVGPGSVASATELMRGFSPDAHKVIHPSVAIHEDEEHDGASIVAVDNRGRTVACSFTMNGPFGSGVLAPGTGILLANTSDGPRASIPSVAMVVNEIVGATFFAVAGSGPVVSTVTRTALETFEKSVGDLMAAISRPRAHAAGYPDIILVEANMSIAEQDGLRLLGHNLQVRPKLGRINGFYCPRGLPRVQTCQFVKDPRSFGLAVSSDE